MRIRDVLTRLIGANNPTCPSDADVLDYSEGRLSENKRAAFERHFATCDDCRQVLAFLGRETDQSPGPISDETVLAQANRVLAYIQNDERRRTTRPAKNARAAGGFRISYPKLAAVSLAICALAIAGSLWFTRGQSAADAAMEALRLAVKDARYTEARVSGGFDHSRYAGTRGGDRNDDDLQFSRAQNKLKGAERDNAPVNDKLALARYHLARGTQQDAKEALDILSQLAARGVETREGLNDAGVAEFQLRNYDRAIALLSKALEKSPNYAEALFNLALAEERANRKDDAKRDWQRFIDQTSDEKWKAEARTHLISPN